MKKAIRGLLDISRVIDPVLDYFFGYDLFISYSRIDWSESYASELLKVLSAHPYDFRCFVDLKDMETGYSWRKQGRRSLRKSSKIILLLTPGATRSTGVFDELVYNSELKPKSKPITIIDVKSTRGSLDRDSRFYKILQKQSDVFEELLFIEEAQDFRPSTELVQRISQDFSLRRENKKRIAWLSSAIAILMLLLIALSWFFMKSEKNLSVSESTRLSMESQQSAGIDRSMLLASAAKMSHQGKKAEEALLSSLLRQPHLKSVVHLGHLVNKVVYSSARTLIVQTGGARDLDSILILRKKGDKFEIENAIQFSRIKDSEYFNDHGILVILMENSIQTVSVDMEKYSLTPGRKINNNILIDLAKDENKLTIYGLTSENSIQLIDVTTMTVTGEIKLPDTTHTPTRSRIYSSNQNLIFSTGTNIWFRKDGDDWHQLNIPEFPNDDLRLANVGFDSTGQYIFALTAIRELVDFPKELSDNYRYFTCWRVSDLARYSGCPAVGPVRAPATVGRFNGQSLLLKAYEYRSHSENTMIYTRHGDKWVSDTLRSELIYGTFLHQNVAGEIFHFSADGVLTLYDLGVYGPGEAEKLNVGITPFLLKSVGDSCFFVIKTERQISSFDCTNIGDVQPVKHVILDGSDRPELTSDKNYIRIIKNNRVIVYDSSLQLIHNIEIPPRALEREVAGVSSTKSHVIIFYIDSGGSHWNAKQKKWRDFDSDGYSVQRLTLVPECLCALITFDEARTGIARLDLKTLDLLLDNSHFGKTIQWSYGLTSIGNGEALLQGFSTEHGIWSYNIYSSDYDQVNLSTVPGPAWIIASSKTSRYLVVEGTGLRTGNIEKVNDSKVYVSLDVWDRSTLSPIGRGIRSRADSWLATLSDDGEDLWLISEPPYKLIKVPLDVATWNAVACKKANRRPTAHEVDYFGMNLLTCELISN